MKERKHKLSSRNVVYLNAEEKSLPSLKTEEPMHETDFSFDRRNKNLEINKVHL